jgi:DNA polymerase delta subunit 1
MEGLTYMEKLVEAIRRGKELEKIINDHFGMPNMIVFAYEKTLFPFLIITKKRYAGILYEDDPTKGKKKIMGLANKKRDTCHFTKNIMDNILSKIFDIKDERAADIKNNEIVKYVVDELDRLIMNKVDMKELVITKALKTDYKSNPPHKLVAERMKARGETVNSNDRIAYVMTLYPPKYNTRGTPIKNKVGDVVEEVNYVVNQGLTYDAEMYITNQISLPIKQILYYITKDYENIFNIAIEKTRLEKQKKYGAPVKALTKRQLAKLEQEKQDNNDASDDD